MKQFIMAVLGLAVLVSGGGCGKSPDDIMKQKIAAFNELADAIDANDEAKAQAAIVRMKNLEAERSGLPPEKQKAVNEKYEKEWGAAMDKWGAAGKKNPQLMKKLDFKPWQ
jgi:hypothetical protein